MLAYDHIIKFVPTLNNSNNITDEDCNAKCITIKENRRLYHLETLNFKMTFINNQGRNISLYTDRKFSRKVSDQKWFFKVDEVVTFFWRSHTSTIEYYPDKKFSPALLKYWTLHTLLPIFLTIEEYCYFLHSGAVEIHNRSVLLMAESFGGKSTITNFFIKQGHNLISDDKVAILNKRGRLMAVPSYPYIRPYRKIEDLGYSVHNISKTPKPIYAIYILHRIKSDAAIRIYEIQGIEKYKALLFGSEINLSFLRSKRFEEHCHLSENIPIFKISLPWDIERLEEVYKIIINHCTVEN